MVESLLGKIAAGVGKSAADATIKRFSGPVLVIVVEIKRLLDEEELLKQWSTPEMSSLITHESSVAIITMTYTGPHPISDIDGKVHVTGANLIGPSLYELPHGLVGTGWEVTVGQESLAIIKLGSMQSGDKFAASLLLDRNPPTPPVVQVTTAPIVPVKTVFN